MTKRLLCDIYLQASSWKTLSHDDARDTIVVTRAQLLDTRTMSGYLRSAETMECRSSYKITVS
jgi:hypothetical protein